MASPFQCAHGIAADSYCNACTQANKLAGHNTGLDAQAAAIQVEVDAVLAMLPSERQRFLCGTWLAPEPPQPVTWREAALISLLKQAEANQRILYLESVMADIVDADFRLRYPFLASKIETALYPPVM